VEVLNTQTKQAIENTTEKMKQTGQEAKAQALTDSRSKGRHALRRCISIRRLALALRRRSRP
jgi:hypothetical protein